MKHIGGKEHIPGAQFSLVKVFFLRRSRQETQAVITEMAGIRLQNPLYSQCSLSAC